MLRHGMEDIRETDRKIKCFYHSADLDGFCSGAVVGYALGWDRIDFRPINYGDPFLWDDIDKEDIVFMVDFSLQPYEEHMHRLRDACNRFIWIDHHKTEIDADNKYEEENPKGKRIEGWRLKGLGACELTWKWFYGDIDDLGEFSGYSTIVPVPSTVYMLSRYDVWDWEDITNCLEFQMGMRSFDCLNPKDWAENNNEGKNLWNKLFGFHGSQLMEQIGTSIVDGGRYILRYRTKDLAISAKSAAFETELFGYKMIAANVGFTNSQFFDSVIDKFPEAVGLITFHYRKKMWHLSMYQIKGRNTPDLGKIAQYLGNKTHHGGGGGGHTGAAGFQWMCERLPFRAPILVSSHVGVIDRSVLSSLGSASMDIPIDFEEDE